MVQGQQGQKTLAKPTTSQPMHGYCRAHLWSKLCGLWLQADLGKKQDPQLKKQKD
jgi:hypothetical protein